MNNKIVLAVITPTTCKNLNNKIVLAMNTAYKKAFLRRKLPDGLVDLFTTHYPM